MARWKQDFLSLISHRRISIFLPSFCLNALKTKFSNLIKHVSQRLIAFDARPKIPALLVDLTVVLKGTAFVGCQDFNILCCFSSLGSEHFIFTVWHCKLPFSSTQSIWYDADQHRNQRRLKVGLVEVALFWRLSHSFCISHSKKKRCKKRLQLSYQPVQLKTIEYIELLCA